jgi:hypothetical protein
MDTGQGAKSSKSHARSLLHGQAPRETIGPPGLYGVLWVGFEMSGYHPRRPGWQSESTGFPESLKGTEEGTRSLELSGVSGTALQAGCPLLTTRAILSGLSHTP